VGIGDDRGADGYPEPVVATAIRPISHEDRLSLVEHLDELRTRLIISLVALAACFALCFWQNRELVRIVNQPLEQQTRHSNQTGGGGPLADAASAEVRLRAALQAFSDANAGNAAFVRAVAADPKTSPAIRAAAEQSVSAQAQGQAALAQAVRALPAQVGGKEPITLGVGEPLFETLKITGYAALIIALPIILWQLYGFVLPAFSPTEKRVARPLMLAIPALFVAGVLFGYFVVLPPAIRFLQGFNDKNFDVLVQAKQYYSFELIVLLGMGLMFQIPVGILGMTQMGIVTPDQFKRNRRYALLGVAVIAAMIPGTDPVTMLISMLPLLVLFEGSIQLAALFERRARRREPASDDVVGLPGHDDIGDDPEP